MVLSVELRWQEDATGPWPTRFTRILQLVRLGHRDGDDLAIEIVMLRHEAAVLRGQVVRPAPRTSDRALLAGLCRLLDLRGRGRFSAQPETPCSGGTGTWSAASGLSPRPGRPSIPAGTVAIILRLAREKPTWGSAGSRGS